MAEGHSSKAEALARKLIEEARTSILLNLRFLDSALYRLAPKLEETTLATDGRRLYYGIPYIFKLYQREAGAIAHAVLHILMHCIFRHPLIGNLENNTLWDLACDMAAESSIVDLDIRSLETAQTASRRDAVAKYQQNISPFTAEKIYRYFLDHPPQEQELSQLQSLFTVDDHACWYQPDMFAAKGSGASDGNGGDSNGDNGSEAMPIDVGEFDNLSDAALSEAWDSIARHVQMDMETFSKSQGIGAGSMSQQLKQLNRERYDYTAFLRKFAVMGEAMKINDDEFDYIFYTYGLNLYENMPLVEPLEYKDVKRIREFVIAIDTSGSTSGDLVQIFLQKTYNILKSTESFFSKVNIHIIQCDAEIQEAVKITSQEEFDDYISHMKIKGLGGTDFQPVFRYVDELLANGEFTRLKGLIYFTDGDGTFPEYMPAYDAAFVFIRNEYDNPQVPPWAIKLVLDEEEI